MHLVSHQPLHRLHRAQRIIELCLLLQGRQLHRQSHRVRGLRQRDFRLGPGGHRVHRLLWWDLVRPWSHLLRGMHRRVIISDNSLRLEYEAPSEAKELGTCKSCPASYIQRIPCTGRLAGWRWMLVRLGGDHRPRIPHDKKSVLVFLSDPTVNATHRDRTPTPYDRSSRCHRHRNRPFRCQ